ncbi:hypothetical protein PABG_11107 [Paracoccidioides brasiliensis Pb03]|nr:hypothetical protein PABG_11107 [Paracoccidioides brasiliensis Pb03]
MAQNTDIATHALVATLKSIGGKTSIEISEITGLSISEIQQQIIAKVQTD